LQIPRTLRTISYAVVLSTVLTIIATRKKQAITTVFFDNMSASGFFSSILKITSRPALDAS
jgi:hypothetical protein